MSANDYRGAEEIGAAAEALYRDYRLPAVRAWKERTGRPAIGYMPSKFRARSSTLKARCRSGFSAGATISRRV